MEKKMIEKKTLKKDKRAVSPVIAEILMVAIVVILAAVIGAFVFGTGSHVKMTYTVAATADHPEVNTVQVTYMGGPDADFVEAINVTVNGNPLTNPSGTDPTWEGSPVPVGSTGNYTSAITGRNNHAIAVARFSDGTEQVILDTYV